MDSLSKTSIRMFETDPAIPPADKSQWLLTANTVTETIEP